MRFKLCLALLASTIWAQAATAKAAPEPEYDLVIRNGRVLDGAGNPWIRADLAVTAGKIVRIGTVAARGKREIDASGHYVSPGFIDMMDQSGPLLLKNGDAESKLRMGVTTVIAGEGGTPVGSAEIGRYFATLEHQGIGVNFGTFYQAAQARMSVMGDGEGQPTPAQLEAMRTDVARAMRAGAFGISSALIYPPSSFQGTDELAELAKVAGKCAGFYATHMRDESAGLLKGVREAIEIGERGGVKVEIFHLKAAYAPGWGRLMAEALGEIDAARLRGADVAADLYPYTAGGTGLSITVPNWVFADGQEKGFARLKDPAVRARLKREVAAGSMPGWSNLVEASGGWKGIVLVNASSDAFARFDMRNIADIAAELKQDPADVAWDIVLAALPRRATAQFFMMSEGDIALALKRPWTSIGSDAAASDIFGAMTKDLPHPRAYGTFPRIIAEYVRDRPVLTLEDAVRKMTSWPATRMGLFDRGVLREGMWADIVIFDLDRIKDGATWAQPYAPPIGVDHVIVNGTVAVEDGRSVKARAGQVLRHRCAD